MAENIQPAAKRTRPCCGTDHEDGTSVPLCGPHLFEDPGHPRMVLEGLNRLRLNGVSCDVILCCEGQEFPCHRYVLASFCSYFEAMFTTSGMMESTQKRVTISGGEPNIIGMLVNYAYTSKVSISSENVQALLAASNLWDVNSVQMACSRFMVRRMDMNNCVGIYCFSEDHSCETLKKRSMDYILENFSGIYKQQEFLSLPVERLTEILASDHLNVPKEDMVFEAAMLWLDRCPTRRQSFEKVLEQIRLPLISPSYRHAVLESLDVVKEYEGCQRFISEAKEQPYRNTALPRRTSVLLMVGLQKWRNVLKSFDPLKKQWKTLGEDSVPRRVNLHVKVASGSTLYVTGPNSENGMCNMWSYDIQNGEWRELPPMNPPTDARLNLALLGGCLFAVGGRAIGKSTDPMGRYDPAKDTWQHMETWQRLAPRYHNEAPIVVALDGWLYFIGGHDPDPDLVQVAKYNPETAVWTEVAPMQTPHEQSAACVLNGKIYVIGCIMTCSVDGRSTANTMECFDPSANQWTSCAPMQEPRRGHRLGVAAMDGKIYVVGGLKDFRFCSLQDIECYCEETDTWEAVGPLPDRHHPACVALRLRNDVSLFNEDDSPGDPNWGDPHQPRLNI